jgi:RNA polymerase-binding transcription factor
MSDTRFEERKRMLEAWRQELQRSLTDKLAAVRANTGHESGRPETLDAADASESDLQLDVSVSLTEMTAEVLHRIDEALARIASGDYGVCAECSADIPTNRLAALPFAVRCRDCEELREVGVRRARRISAERRSSPGLDAD